jgi:hypothetical protein
LISPATYNFTIYQGATFDRVFQFNDANGDPLATSGWSARMQVRSSIETATTLLSLTPSINSTGLVTLALTATQTTALPGDVAAVYDLELVDGTDVHRVLMGTVTISGEVTR